MNAGATKDTMPAVRSSETIMLVEESHHWRVSTFCQLTEIGSGRLMLEFGNGNFIRRFLAVPAIHSLRVHSFCINRYGGLRSRSLRSAFEVINGKTPRRELKRQEPKEG